MPDWIWSRQAPWRQLLDEVRRERPPQRKESVAEPTPMPTPEEAAWNTTAWREAAWGLVIEGACPYNHGLLQPVAFQGRTQGWCAECACGCGDGWYYRAWTESNGDHVWTLNGDEVRVTAEDVARIRAEREA